MDTMIGFARISPTSTPWSPVTSAPNTNAPASAGTRPALLRMVTNMNADAAAVAPRAKDMMAPPIVMNVIPAAMQPIIGFDAVMKVHETLADLFRKNGSKLVRTGFVNGLPGFITVEAYGEVQTTALDIEDGKVTAIYVVRNPDKLRHLH